MLEDQLSSADRDVFDHVFALLSDGPLPVGDLATRLTQAGLTQHFDVVRNDGGQPITVEELADLVASEVLEILTLSDRFCFDDERVFRVDLLLEGVVMTHRLSATEVERGGLEIEPDFAAIDFDLHPGEAREIDGQVAEIDLVLHGGRDAWILSDGLPRGCGEGDLVALRRVGATFELLTGEELAAAVADADRSRVVDMIVDAVDEVHDTGIGLEPDEIVLHLLTVEPDVFSSPLPPLDELFDDPRLSRQGDFVGPADAEWEPLGARFARIIRERRVDAWGFDDCCEEAFAIVDEAWTDHLIGRDRRHDDAEVRSALSHSAVSLAMLEYWDQILADPMSVSDFLEPVSRSTRREAAPALFARGAVLERAGAALAAEQLFEKAVLCDDGFTPPMEALALYAFERGDLRKAISWFDRCRGSGTGHPMAELLREMVGPAVEAGRNDPCPCGSGRKYKACHRNQPLPVRLSPASMLAHKSQMHLFRRLPGLIDGICAGVDDEAMARLEDDEFVADVALYEGGGLEHFVDQRREVLAPEEVAAAEEWMAAPRRLFEVVDVDPGERMELRDLTTGECHRVIEHSGSQRRTAGDYLLARMVPRDVFEPEADGPVIVGVVMEVPMQARMSLFAVLDRGPDADELVEWYALASGPPTMRNRSGHDLVFCELSIDPQVDPATAAVALDRVFGGDGRDLGEALWHWSVPASPTSDEMLLAARIEMVDGLLAVSVNSDERADEVLALLAAAFPDRVIRHEVRTPLEDLDLDALRAGSEISEPTPEMQAAAEEFMRRYEESWIDDSIPALGGLTPRQAMEDPTRRADLERLLTSMPSVPAGAAGMDPDRLRALLALG